MLQPDRNRNAAPRLGAKAASARTFVGRSLARLATIVALATSSPEQASALRINSAADPALAGALIQTFDTIPVGYFTSQSFLIGTNGFTLSTLANDVHIDDVFCGNFGTSGRCFDTVRSNGTANDDFNVTFTGSGVNAFGFAINALDVDWTVQTFGAGNVLLNTYTITSQSPGLTGNNRRGYFGATEIAAIQSIQIRSFGSDRALIDDFAYVPTPEPGPALLLGLGLAGLAAGAERRRPTPSA